MWTGRTGSILPALLFAATGLNAEGSGEKMQMRLDQAGQHGAALRVDPARAGGGHGGDIGV